MINVLIVDDSETIRVLLSHVISREPGMNVIGIASDGEQAVRLAKDQKPDLITMDITMPKKDGLQATREIMASCATPIIIVSQYRSQSNEQDVFECLEAGALAVVNKPTVPMGPRYEKDLKWLLRNIRLLSEVKVVTRKPVTRADPANPVSTSSLQKCSSPPSPGKSALKFVAIGASTGGPVVLREILGNIPAPYPLPIVIVQHIAAGFLEGLVDWLAQSTGQQVRIARHGEVPEPGVVYFAPDDHQTGINVHGRIQVLKDPEEYGLRPSVAYLYKSLAMNFAARTLPILLTGMGIDGSKELGLLRSAGARTIIQDKASCVVFGMPGEAQRLKAAQHAMNPREIADFLTRISRTPHNDG